MPRARLYYHPTKGNLMSLQKVRAKFKCDMVNESETGFTWRMSPVYANNDPEHENSKFWKYTPSGNLEITVNKEEYKGENPAPGDEFYVDLTRVPKIEK